MSNNPTISISSGSLYSYGLNRFFNIANKSGFKNVELIIDDRWDTKQPKYLNYLKKEFKLSIPIVHQKFCDRYPDEDPIDDLYFTAEIAYKINSKFINTHLQMNPVWDTIWDQKLPQAIKNIKKQYGIIVLVENVHYLPKEFSLFGFHMNKKYYYKSDIKRFDKYNMITLDLSHLSVLKYDIFDAYDKYRNKIYLIHLSDFIEDKTIRRSKPPALDQHYLPGKGKLELINFYRFLRRKQYNKFITFELNPKHLSIGENDQNIISEITKSRIVLESSLFNKK